MIESSVIKLILDPRIRNIVISDIEDWMFDGELEKKLFRAISDSKYSEFIPDERIFILDLHNKYSANERECKEALEILRSHSSLKNVNLEQAIKTLEQFIRDKKISKELYNLINQDTSSVKPETYGKLQKALSYQITSDHFYDFSDTNQLLAAQTQDSPENDIIIKSSLNLINRNASYGGLKYGDLMMICGETGTGKSTLALNDTACVVEQGHKVCHLFLGDMTEFDGLVKLLAIWNNVSINKIIGDIMEFITPEIREKLSRVRFKAYPAQNISVYEILGKVEALRRNFKFDWLTIDYDGNIKETKDNIYLEGGTTYSAFKGYAMHKCVVQILSQIKIGYWNKEIFSKDAPSESSKKQHTVDIQLGLGRNSDCRVVGTVNLHKLRRGIDNEQTRVHLNYSHAKITEISREKYEALKIQYKNKKEMSSRGELPESINPEGFGGKE